MRGILCQWPFNQFQSTFSIIQYCSSNPCIGKSSLNLVQLFKDRSFILCWSPLDFEYQIFKLTICLWPAVASFIQVLFALISLVLLEPPGCLLDLPLLMILSCQAGSKDRSNSQRDPFLYLIMTPFFLLKFSFFILVFSPWFLKSHSWVSNLTLKILKMRPFPLGFWFIGWVLSFLRIK